METRRRKVAGSIPRYKVALVTWVAIYPALTITLAVLGPPLAPLPPLRPNARGHRSPRSSHGVRAGARGAAGLRRLAQTADSGTVRLESSSAPLALATP